jgi:hypothetical protein
MKTIFLAMLVLALLGLGCESDEGSGGYERGSARTGPAEGEETSGGPRRPKSLAPPEDKVPTQVLVTSSDPSLPEGCRPRQVAGLVLDFFDAFNAGDQERLSRLFFVSEGPSPPDFSSEGYYTWSWYLVSETGPGGRIDDGFVTYDEGELLEYFDRRHERRERLELLKVGVTGPGLLGEAGNVGIVYVLSRTADDLRAELGGPDHVAFGKGAINCGRRQIFAWSIEMRAEEDRGAREAAGWLCENPPGFRPGENVVACG